MDHRRVLKAIGGQPVADRKSQSQDATMKGGSARAAALASESQSEFDRGETFENYRLSNTEPFLPRWAFAGSG